LVAPLAQIGREILMSHYHAVVWIDHQKATAWHPTDPEVLAYARRHFTAIDRMFAPGA
jgi:hypothetical protein